MSGIFLDRKQNHPKFSVFYKEKRKVQIYILTGRERIRMIEITGM